MEEGEEGEGRRRRAGRRGGRLQAFCPSVRRGLDRRTHRWGAGASCRGTGCRCVSGEGQTEKKGPGAVVTPSPEQGCLRGPSHPRGRRVVAGSRWWPRGPAWVSFLSLLA